jgi:hypothetical protein
MAEATNEQVQAFADQRIRPRCEQIRNLYLACKDDVSAIGDVYENIAAGSDWTDTRTDNPPHLMTPNDIIGWNQFISGLIQFYEASFPDLPAAGVGGAQYPVVLDCCVRGVG